MNYLYLMKIIFNDIHVVIKEQFNFSQRCNAYKLMCNLCILLL